MAQDGNQGVVASSTTASAVNQPDAAGKPEISGEGHGESGMIPKDRFNEVLREREAAREEARLSGERAEQMEQAFGLLQTNPEEFLRATLGDEMAEAYREKTTGKGSAPTAGSAGVAAGAASKPMVPPEVRSQLNALSQQVNTLGLEILGPAACEGLSEVNWKADRTQLMASARTNNRTLADAAKILQLERFSAKQLQLEADKAKGVAAVEGGGVSTPPPTAQQLDALKKVAYAPGHTPEQWEAYVQAKGRASRR